MVVNQYGILASIINCENQLSWGFLKFCRTLNVRVFEHFTPFVPNATFH